MNKETILFVPNIFFFYFNFLLSSFCCDPEVTHLIRVQKLKTNLIKRYRFSPPKWILSSSKLQSVSNQNPSVEAPIYLLNIWRSCAFSFSFRLTTSKLLCFQVLLRNLIGRLPTYRPISIQNIWKNVNNSALYKVIFGEWNV